MRDVVGLAARNGLSPEAARRILPVLGINADIGERFPCVLPGFAGTLSAVVDPDSLRYRASYDGAPKQWCSLAEVFASRVAGRTLDLTGQATAHRRWWLRLRHKANLLKLDLPAVELPGGASPAARIVAPAFCVLYAINGIDHPGEPVAFAQRFASGWCGLPRKIVAQAIRELVQLGVLRHEGVYVNEGGPGWRTPTYRPAVATASVGEPATTVGLH